VPLVPLMPGISFSQEAGWDHDIGFSSGTVSHPVMDSMPIAAITTAESLKIRRLFIRFVDTKVGVVN